MIANDTKYNKDQNQDKKVEVKPTDQVEKKDESKDDSAKKTV